MHQLQKRGDTKDQRSHALAPGADLLADCTKGLEATVEVSDGPIQLGSYRGNSLETASSSKEYM